MSLPPATMPLYNHSLHSLEAWLDSHGCTQDREMQNRWFCEHEGWKAEITLEETVIQVSYAFVDGTSKVLTFPYSLSRQDIDSAIFGDDM